MQKSQVKRTTCKESKTQPEALRLEAFNHQRTFLAYKQLPLLSPEEDGHYFERPVHCGPEDELICTGEALSVEP